MASKYNGIDEREIKCSDKNEGTIESGISFDRLEDGTNVLRFHFLVLTNSEILYQKTKTMYLDKSNTKQLIELLSNLEFK